MKPLYSNVPIRILRGFEWILVLFGTAISIWVSIVFASHQLNDLWPLPGLYFLEILLLALAALTSLALDTRVVNFDYSLLCWVVGGILLAFVILAGFSIGPYLFPAMLAFWLAAVLSDVRQHRSIRKHLVWTVLAAFFQGALIIILYLISSAGNV